MLQPLVGIVMGSDSDLPIMREAAKIMERFSVAYEMEIASVHRTPDFVFEYAASAEERGLKIIIAGAGGAAHLPGLIAPKTLLPVIAVPINSPLLGGIDSLLSIVQMPYGVPVGTQGINQAANAGLFAVQFLAQIRPELREPLTNFREELEQSTLAKNQFLHEVGWRKYLTHLS
jgi:5-(carboxyamino)imidazole ribonucleotide mutase